MRQVGDRMNKLAPQSLLWVLIGKELRIRYLGSFLGMFWAFVQPAITLFIFWFVFEVGFRVVPVEGVAFVPWLMCGMIPWFFISDSILTATNAVKDNSFLVKKIVFPVYMLPLVKIGASLAVHLVFLAVLLLVFVLYGQMPNLYWLQIPYYAIASIVLVCGIGWLTSALVIFLPDVGQFTAMLMQFCFWLTPIFWSSALMPTSLQWVLGLNPFHYIINGYRNSLIAERWFWQEPLQTSFFWLIAGTAFFGGAWLFRRLRSQFADVL